MEEVSAFDIERMLIGDNFSALLLLEIVFRTAFMYLAALILVRFIGKRGLGQLSPFEYLIVIAMGSAAGDPMFYPDVPLIHGVLVLAAIVLLQKGLIGTTERSSQVAHFVESVPTLLIRDGVVMERDLWAEGLNREELFVKLREQGVSDTSQVHLAYLEPSGALSVFRGPVELRMAEGESTLPESSS